jgi:hypothetical protein
MNITFYDSTEEMWNALGEAMEKADENTQEWQKAIKKGECWKMPTMKSTYVITVFANAILLHVQKGNSGTHISVLFLDF